MLLLQELQRRSRFLQRKGLGDDRLHPACVDELPDLGEVLAAFLHCVSQAAHAKLRGPCLRGLSQSRNQNSALLQDLPRALLRLAPNEVVDHVDLADFVLEALLLVIDDLIGAEFVGEVDVLARDSCCDTRSLGFRELDREMTDAA